MLKAKKWNCNNCWVEVLQWILIKNNWLCNTCNLQKDNSKVSDHIKWWEVKIKRVKDKEIKVSWDTYNWLPLYTINYLNKSMKKDYNSIKDEKICIKYKDKYILHSDIIEQFKNGLDKIT